MNNKENGISVNQKNSKAKRVMFVSAVADFKGGAETCLKQFMNNPAIIPVLVVPEKGELSAYANENSIEVKFVNLGRVNNVRRPFKLSALFSAGIDAIRVCRKINQMAIELNIDCIHSNGLKTHGILALRNNRGKAPLICHIHDIPYTSKEKLFWRFLAWRSNRLILVSEYCWPGELPINAHVISNAIDVKYESLFPKKIPIIINVGFIGRIHPYKGLDRAVEWLAKSRQAGIEFRFYIRGEAAPAEKGYEILVRELIAKHVLDDYCFFEGRVSGYDNVYKDLDLVLMPSVVDEPFGLVAIESFDQGIPCFAYPSGALPSIVEHDISGYLCKSPTDFLESLERLIESDASYNAIRFNAHRRLKEAYSIELLYEQLNFEYLEASENV